MEGGAKQHLEITCWDDSVITLCREVLVLKSCGVSPYKACRQVGANHGVNQEGEQTDVPDMEPTGIALTFKITMCTRIMKSTLNKVSLEMQC